MILWFPLVRFALLRKCAERKGFSIKTHSNKALARSLDECDDPNDPDFNRVYVNMCMHVALACTYMHVALTCTYMYVAYMHVALIYMHVALCTYMHVAYMHVALTCTYML